MIYIVSTFISSAIILYTSRNITKRIEEEGYEILPPKQTKSEVAMEILQVIGFLLCPILNVVGAVYSIVKYEDLYKDTLIDYEKEERLIKKEDQNNHIEMDIETNDLNMPKKYSELSNDEKLRILEEERKRLLSEKNNKSTNESAYSHGTYRKKF